MRSHRARLLFLALMSLAASPTQADRRYFLQSYTPYLVPAGELELEVWTIARNGQGDSTGTAWVHRMEFEYAITDRLTAAAYLNFAQPAGESGAMRFDGPSLELIHRLAEHGRFFVDPALYLEVTANDEALEIEPKLLLARRHGRLVAVANLIGEFETHHSGAGTGEWSKALGLTAGLSQELGAVAALAVEAAYHREFDEASDHPAALLAGPTLNVQSGKAQLTLAWHPQVWGRPPSDGLNLRDFPRSEIRMLIGVDL